MGIYQLYLWSCTQREEGMNIVQKKTFFMTELKIAKVIFHAEKKKVEDCYCVVRKECYGNKKVALRS